MIFRALILSSLFAGSLFAAELKVQVTDPQSHPVVGARVAVFPQDASKPLAVSNSDAQGTAVFPNVETKALRVEVLAPGFAPLTLTADQESVTAQLHVAAQSETVVVTATPSPIEAARTGMNVSALDEPTLRSLQPVSASDALRFLPGVVVSDSGNRGGQTTLFVRGGDSRYNKVLLDGVPVAEPGGFFDFGTLSMAGIDRVELMRGSESVLYGSDAMTSVVQISSAQGRTRVPEVRFGADGGTFGTAHGSASVAGANGKFDYNAYADQFNTLGQGTNDEYTNATQGLNAGYQFDPKASVRFRVRHTNARTGVPGETTFLGHELLAPDSDAYARQNNLLASTEFDFSAPARYQHRVLVYEYNHQNRNIDNINDSWRPFDYPYAGVANINRFGVNYNGEYWERNWARSNFGYEFEDENGWVGDDTLLPLNHGLRRNHAVFGEQFVSWKNLTAIAGVRYVHNESFGDRAVPRVSLTYLLGRGDSILRNTRLRANYSEGIKEPRFEESFGVGGYGIVANPDLKPEENRNLEAGVEQRFGSRISAVATYFNNQFRNRIDYALINPALFEYQYININKAMAHGAELDLNARLSNALQLQGSYFYTSTQVLEAPLAFDPLASAGAPLLRRPKHAGTLLLSYNKQRFGGTLGGTFIGRRPDSDYMGYGYTHAAGYARVDMGAWYAIERHVTAYANVENLLNRRYEEVLGYPALKANFRAGLRFRFGGE